MCGVDEGRILAALERARGEFFPHATHSAVDGWTIPAVDVRRRKREKAARLERRYGTARKTVLMVRRLDTGEILGSAPHAAKRLGVSVSLIRQSCNDGMRCKGLYLGYVGRPRPRPLRRHEKPVQIGELTFPSYTAAVVAVGEAARAVLGARYRTVVWYVRNRRGSVV